MTARSNIAAALTGAALALGGVVAAPHVVPAKAARIEVKWGTPTGYTERAGYVLAFDHGRKTAAWTLHYLDGARVLAHSQRASFRADESLPAECRAVLDDYHGTTLHDRGHLVPAADADWSTASALDAGLLSNIAPQDSRLNRGPWASLEQYIRDIASRPNTQVWCFTGVLDAPEPLPKVGKRTDGGALVQWIGPNHIRVPTHWWKAILVQCGGAIELLAWIAPNGPYDVPDLDRWLVSVDQLESLTGLDLFSWLPDAQERRLEAM